MANDICTSLRLNDKDLSGKLLQVVEEQGSCASFLISSLMWNAAGSGTSVCLVAVHNSLSHYQNVTKKLSFNLKNAMDAKTVVVLEPFSVHFEKTRDFSDTHIGKEVDLNSLFSSIKEALGSISGKKCLMIDDVSDLLCMGASLSSVVGFVQCCRSLQEEDGQLCVMVCSHRPDESEDLRVLADYISHVADLRIIVAGLKTGFSANVTGTIEVVDNTEDSLSAISDRKLFHYQTTQRHIKVFAPGTVGIHN